MKITVCYFASMRDQAGVASEDVETTAAHAGDLYKEVKSRHAFQHTPAELGLAINDQFSDWPTALREGDVVSFLPPVSGG